MRRDRTDADMEPNPESGRSPDVTVPTAAVRQTTSAVPDRGGALRPEPPVKPATPPAGADQPSSSDADADDVGAPDEIAGPDSFEYFYATERVRLGRAVALALGEVDLAAEATDEAFARAYERWATISRGNPAGWVYRVALNWALSVLRRRKLRRDRPLYDSQVSDFAVGDPAVGKALAALDPMHRGVVVCRHLLGWSVAETADALHLREGTVKSRLARANQILRTQLHHLRPEEQA